VYERNPTSYVSQRQCLIPTLQKLASSYIAYDRWVYKNTNARLDVGVLVCIRARVYVFKYACMYICLYVYMSIYMHACMYACFMCAHGVCGCVNVRIDIYVRGETDKNISNMMSTLKWKHRPEGPSSASFSYSERLLQKNADPTTGYFGSSLMAADRKYKTATCQSRLNECWSLLESATHCSRCYS